MGNFQIVRWNEVYAPNAAMLRLKLEREGYRVFQWGDRPEMVYATRCHPQDQSHWIISGEMEITAERIGTYRLKAGDRDFLPAETYHSARVIGDKSVIYLVGEKIS